MARYNNEIEDEQTTYIKRAIKIIIGVVLGIIIIIALFGTFYTIPAGYRGVLLTFGKPDMIAQGEGLHFKLPFVQKVVKMQVQTQRYTVEKTSAASKDLQVATTDVTINYIITPETVPTLYRDIGVGYKDNVIIPAVLEVVKASTAQYTAEELITKRPEVKDKIDIGLRERLSQWNIAVQAVSITNFDFSPEFNKAIEQKVVATQLKLKSEQDLQRIEVEAKQRVAQASGEADAIRAQISAIASQGGANYLTMLWIQKWDGKVSVVNGGNSIVDLRGMNSAGYLTSTTPQNMINNTNI